MCKMNVLEAKTNFSKLLALLESKEEEEIIICKSNKPVAKIVRLEEEPNKKKLFGMFKGSFSDVAGMSLDEFDSDNDEIARMFGMID